MMEKIMEKFRKLKRDRENAFGMDTDEVEDRSLRSLRKQRQRQLNEMEKKHLKSVVKSYNDKKTRAELFGVNGGAKKTDLNRKINKHESLLNDKRPLLKEKSKKWG